MGINDFTRVVINGLPSDFTLEGAVRTEEGLVLENPILDERGNIQIRLSYPVPSDDSFSLHFRMEAEFDPDATDEDGNPIALPLVTFLETEGSQLVTVRNAFSAEDLNYTDADGNLVWVLTNNPNPNRIFSGSGNDEIRGSVADDVIQGGERRVGPHIAVE